MHQRPDFEPKILAPEDHFLKHEVSIKEPGFEPSQHSNQNFDPRIITLETRFPTKNYSTQMRILSQ